MAAAVAEAEIAAVDFHDGELAEGLLLAEAVVVAGSKLPEEADFGESSTLAEEAGSGFVVKPAVA